MLLGIRLGKPKERQVDDKMRLLKLIVGFLIDSFFFKYVRSNTNEIAILLVRLKKLYVNACIIQVKNIADIAIYSQI